MDNAIDVEMGPPPLCDPRAVPVRILDRRHQPSSSSVPRRDKLRRRRQVSGTRSDKAHPRDTGRVVPPDTQRGAFPGEGRAGRRRPEAAEDPCRAARHHASALERHCRGGPPVRVEATVRWWAASLGRSSGGGIRCAAQHASSREDNTCSARFQASSPLGVAWLSVERLAGHRAGRCPGPRPRGGSRASTTMRSMQRLIRCRRSQRAPFRVRSCVSSRVPRPRRRPRPA